MCGLKRLSPVRMSFLVDKHSADVLERRTNADDRHILCHCSGPASTARLQRLQNSHEQICVYVNTRPAFESDRVISVIVRREDLAAFFKCSKSFVTLTRVTPIPFSFRCHLYHDKAFLMEWSFPSLLDVSSLSFRSCFARVFLVAIQSKL